MKKLIITIFIASMCLNLIACSNQKKTEEPKQAQTTSNDQSDNNIAKYDPNAKFDPPIDITTIKVSDTSYGYPEDEDAGHNGVYDIIKENLGINFINGIECAPAAYEEKIKLSVISNNLPDIGMVPKDMMDMLIKNDMVEDLTPVVNQYGSPKTQEIFHFNDDILIKPVTREDKVYGYPVSLSIYNNTPLIWIRNDWLKNLGLEPPKTMEDVIEIAKAFTKNDPNKNNIDDTYGLPLTKEIFDVNANFYTNFMNAYGVYPRAWVKNEQGELINGSADPNTKEGLEILQDLYEEGVIDPEFAVKDLNKIEEDIAAGKYGMHFGLFYHPLFPLYNSYMNEPESDWTPYLIPPAEGKDNYKFYMPLNITGYVYVKKGFEHPEAAMMLINGEFDSDCNFGKAWNELNQDPKYRGLMFNNWLPFSCQFPDMNDGMCIKKYLDEGIDPLKEKLYVNENAWDILTNSDDSDPQKWAFEKIMLDAYIKLDKLDFNNFIYDEYVGPPTKTQSQIQSILYQKEEETIMKIIMGNQVVDSYDEFIKNWYDLGGEQVLKEVNQNINELK